MNPRPESDLIALRSVHAGDLPVLYRQQQDPEANRLAATYPRTLQAFHDYWEAILQDHAIIARAVLVNATVAGCISLFSHDDRACVGYWIGRDYWGRGVATEALRQLLKETDVRPIYAQVAAHNLASLRVLEKCGFREKFRQPGCATERYVACEEVHLQLM